MTAKIYYVFVYIRQFTAFETVWVENVEHHLKTCRSLSIEAGKSNLKNRHGYYKFH